MANENEVQTLLHHSIEEKLTNEQENVLLNNDEIRLRNREQLIENLQRVIQEKNASIVKLQQREQYLEETLEKRNTEFQIVEEKLKLFEEKTHTFEQLHQLQLQTFHKTLRDSQTENERLCEHIHDLTRELRGKISFDEINKEKILTFDRIVSDIQLWRQKLDSYKLIIEQNEQTIVNLKKEIDELQKEKRTECIQDDSSLRLQILDLQNMLSDRDEEIDKLKMTLRRVRDKLQPTDLSHESRWESCHDNIGRHSSAEKQSRSISPRNRKSSTPIDIEYLKRKFQTVTDRLSNVQKLLVERDNQMITLKKVHDKRWFRLKHLQKQYRHLKNELQTYTDDEILQINTRDDYFYRKAIRKTKNGCSVCNDHRWRKPTTANRKLFKQEDDDQVWNEVTKLRRENAKLTNENFNMSEKVDSQEIELNEQNIVINELRTEIQRLINKDEIKQPIQKPKSDNEQKRIDEDLRKRIYQLENDRTCLKFEFERLKTNYDLGIDEKHNLLQQKIQANNEIKRLKLRILFLQDQVEKFKRINQMNSKKESLTSIKHRIVKKKIKKPIKTKSCLEILLDQSSTFIDDLHNESIVMNKPKTYSNNFVNQQNEDSFRKYQRRPRVSTNMSKKNIPLKRNLPAKHRLTTSILHSNSIRKPSIPTVRIATLRKRIEDLEGCLVESREENEYLNQRLTTTLSRINILKTMNQNLTMECNKYKSLQVKQSTTVDHDLSSVDSSINIDNLNERLRNISCDASQQRKLNKSLQADNESLNRNLQLLTEKLTHTERDINSKRLLIENYKTRLNEMEINLNRSIEKPTIDNNDERIKCLNETVEKLRVSIDSYKNRLQAVTREKHDVDTRHTQLLDEHQKLKTRFDDIQTKFRLTDQQLRQIRSNNEQLNEELTICRRTSEQQLLTLNNKSQESLKRITLELERTARRLNEYENFINTLLQEIIRRSLQITEKLKRAHEHKKQRESFSLSLPGYDTAMNTASKILNLTQDDLDELMSVADESFQINSKQENVDKNEKIRAKVSKLLLSNEEVCSKLLKIFSKKLDEIQITDRELTSILNC